MALIIPDPRKLCDEFIDAMTDIPLKTQKKKTIATIAV
jgi:hypothetical protein